MVRQACPTASFWRAHHDCVLEVLSLFINNSTLDSRYKMKNLIQIFIAMLFIQTSYGQSASCDSLLKDIEAINGEWTWVESYSLWVTHTPETDSVQKRIVIKDYKKLEIYINEKLEQTCDIKFSNIVDHTFSFGKDVILICHGFYYVLDHFEQNKTEIFLANHGTFELCNNEFLDIRCNWCIPRMAEEYEKVK
jgi:hypothetical protein